MPLSSPASCRIPLLLVRRWLTSRSSIHYIRHEPPECPPPYDYFRPVGGAHPRSSSRKNDRAVPTAAASTTRG